MNSYRAVCSLGLVLVVLGVIDSIDGSSDIGPCFDCICRGKNDCGITHQFWIDAGKLGNDYNLCMQDSQCPRYTMEQYYLKFQQDCNGDGAINCYDFARIHILGPYACGGPENYELQKIHQCFN